MAARDALDDREAQARAACAAARVVEARDRPLQALDFTRRDAGATVAHLERDAFRLPFRYDFDRLPG